MKKLTSLLGFFTLAIAFTSCKSDQQKKAEIVTSEYVLFIDSVTSKGTANAMENWDAIARDFDKKSNKLNIEIDKLEDITAFDKKINPATAKYEAFRNLTFEKKLRKEQQEEQNLLSK